MTEPVSYFDATDPIRRLAYRYTPPSLNAPTVVYLYGFRSDMGGEKILYLEALCRTHGFGFLTFDYSGHGLSSGQFEEGAISQWLADSLTLIDHLTQGLTQGRVILAGSSMGGWIAPLVALRRPYLVSGLLGIASAPDFTEELLWQKFTKAQKSELLSQGVTIVPTEYNQKGWNITKNLIEDGRKHLLLGKAIDLSIPIRLVHGLQDASVPASYSHQLVERVSSTDVTLTLIKSGDHRLNRPEDKQIIGELLLNLVAVIP